MHRGDAIDAGQRADIAGEGLHAGLQIGADGGGHFGAHREEMALLVQCKLGLGDVVARLRVAEERLRARRHPSHRPARDLRGEQHQRNLIVDRGFHAEAAADIAGYHADLALRHFQDG